jgi:hypothetical protein
LGKNHYRFAIPDFPAMPILSKLHMDMSQFAKWTASSIENNAKFPLLTELDLGYPIDLVYYYGKMSLILNIRKFCLLISSKTYSRKS